MSKESARCTFPEGEGEDPAMADIFMFLERVAGMLRIPHAGCCLETARRNTCAMVRVWDRPSRNGRSVCLYHFMVRSLRITVVRSQRRYMFLTKER